jgi:lysophospholipase L1-like esterase
MALEFWGPSETELSATYATRLLARPRPNTVATMGDSTTSYNNNDIQQGQGYFYRLCADSQGRIKSAGIYATGGYTLEQIETTHLPTVLALNPKPGWCVVFGGTNNTGASAGAGYDAAAAKATHRRIVDALVNAGIMPILVRIPPRSDSATVRTNVADWNAHIDNLGTTTGLPVFDAHTPANNAGSYKTGYSDDGVHPNNLGHDMIARYNLSQGFADLFTAWQRPTGYHKELVPTDRGLFLTDSNADGLADNWTAAGGADAANTTTTIITPYPGDNVRGKWQELALATARSGDRWIQTLLNTDWTVGETIEVTAPFQAVNFTDSNGTYTLGVLPVGAASSPYGIYLWKRDVANGLFRTTFTIPTGTTALYFRAVSSPGSGLTKATQLRIGEVSVRNRSRASA